MDSFENKISFVYSELEDVLFQQPAAASAINIINDTRLPCRTRAREEVFHKIYLSGIITKGFEDNLCVLILLPILVLAHTVLKISP